MKCESCGKEIHPEYIPELHEHLLSCFTKSCPVHIRKLKRKLSRIKKFRKDTKGMTEQEKIYYIRHMRY